MFFLNDHCFLLQNVLKRLDLQSKVRFYFSKTHSLRSIFSPHKEKISCDVNCHICPMCERENICLKKNLIYFIKCSLCDSVYIGETKRFLKTRINEHLKNNTSAVFRHHSEHHQTHNIFNIFSIRILHDNLCYDSRRLALESMYIQKYSRHIMNGCEGNFTHYNFNSQ